MDDGNRDDVDRRVYRGVNRGSSPPAYARQGRMARSTRYNTDENGQNMRDQSDTNGRGSSYRIIRRNDDDRNARDSQSGTQAYRGANRRGSPSPYRRRDDRRNDDDRNDGENQPGTRTRQEDNSRRDTNTNNTNDHATNAHHAEELARNDKYASMWRVSQVRIFENIMDKFLMTSGLWDVSKRSPDSKFIGKVKGYIKVSLVPPGGLRNRSMANPSENGCSPGSMCTDFMTIYPGIKYPVSLYDIMRAFLDASDAFHGMHDVRDLQITRLVFIVRSTVSGKEKKLRLKNIKLRTLEAYVKGIRDDQDTAYIAQKVSEFQSQQAR